MTADQVQPAGQQSLEYSRARTLQESLTVSCIIPLTLTLCKLGHGMRQLRCRNSRTSYDHVLSLLLVVFWLVLGLGRTTQTRAQSDSSAGPKTKTVVAGSQYASPPGGTEFILGNNYRDLWTTPIEVEVLNLQTFAGGLVPVMRVGGLQTLGLAFKGQDGRDYTFRSVDKEYGDKVIPYAFRDTLIEEFIQDQIAANFPGVQVVTAPFEKAAGVLAPEKARLVVMPDDPALGKFQKDFAGVLGTIILYPQPVSDTNPGFHDATAILGHQEFWDLRQAGTIALPDTHAFLRARLLDIFLNDWDRHRLQWRWARIPGKPLLQPIPEDRDQVFSNFEGLALWMARLSGAQMVQFREEFPPLYRITQNGWDVDRFILTNVDKSEWMQIAAEVQSQLTDEVIDEALRRMPKEYYRLRGQYISTRLKHRRDGLLELAEKYYYYLADYVDVQCSNAEDAVVVKGYENGDVLVTVSAPQTGHAVTEPYYHRRFKKDETNEVRIYLHGGDNQVVTLGNKGRGIKVRVIGGSGDSTVDDSQGFGVKFYDSKGNSQVIGNGGTRVNSKPFKMPPRPQPENDTPWVPVQDWGGRKGPLIVAGYHSDPGFILGGGLGITKHGFRKYPWAQHHRLRGAFAIGALKPFFDYSGALRKENSPVVFGLNARLSGIDQLRYYGLGNETSNSLPDKAYLISSYQASIYPAVALAREGKGALAFGPILKYSDSTGTNENTVLVEEMPLGYEKFGQLGFQARYSYDSRDPRAVLQPGIQVKSGGAYYLGVWDAEGAFGSIDGEFGSHISLADPLLLSLFIGGEKVWGDFPFFEAAYIGGDHALSGYKWNRFAGDASLYGQAQLRWTFKRLAGVIPGRFGVFFDGDVGRVFLEGEDSKKWHPSYGGGVFVAPFRGIGIFHIGVGDTSEGTFFIFRASLAGFGFGG